LMLTVSQEQKKSRANAEGWSVNSVLLILAAERPNVYSIQGFPGSKYKVPPFFRPRCDSENSAVVKVRGKCRRQDQTMER